MFVELLLHHVLVLSMTEGRNPPVPRPPRPSTCARKQNTSLRTRPARSIQFVVISRTCPNRHVYITTQLQLRNRTRHACMNTALVGNNSRFALVVDLGLAAGALVVTPCLAQHAENARVAEQVLAVQLRRVNVEVLRVKRCWSKTSADPLQNEHGT